MEALTLGSGIGGLARGIQAVFLGLGSLIRQPDLRRLALIPLAITLVAYVLAGGVAIFMTDDLLALVWDQPAEGPWLYVWYALIPIIFVVIIAVMFLAFVSIAALISGPFYEKMVLKILKEHEIEVRDVGIVKGAISEIIRALVFLGPAVAFGLLGLIPGVGVPFVILGTIIASLGLASTAASPALAVTGYGTRAQIEFVLQSRMVMIGIGGVIAVSLLVPVLGLLSVPSAVIGVTQLYAKSIKKPPPPQPA